MKERTSDIRKTNEQLSKEISDRIIIEEKLKKQAEELEKYRYSLQELVKERTAELESNTLKMAKEVVDRRQAEKALTESERKFMEIAQNVPGMIFQLRVRTDGSNYFTYMSPQASEIFDLPVEYLNAEWNIIDRIHPDDKASFMASIVRVFSEKTDWNYIGRIVKSNGEIKWFHGFTSPTYVGEELVLDGIMLDITEQKMAEQALAESEQRYRTLFNSMTEGFALHEIICDASGKPVDYLFLSINDAFEKLTGLKRENVVGKKLSEVLPDEDPKWVKLYGKVALTGKSVNFENYSPALDRYYVVNAYRPAPGQVAVIFREVTHKKR